MIFELRGGGGEAGARSPSMVTFTFGFAASFSSSPRTASLELPGKIRQLTFARARCGNALVAWPPSSMVATQVVRRVAFQLGSFEDTRAIAFASAGSLTIAFIAAAMSALPFAAWIFAMPRK